MQIIKFDLFNLYFSDQFSAFVNRPFTVFCHFLLANLSSLITQEPPWGLSLSIHYVLNVAIIFSHFPFVFQAIFAMENFTYL